jgi:signal transduction histidine kinase
MSIKEIQSALDKAGQDDALVRHFLSVWPLVEGILEAFSKATNLPIFGFLGETKVFQSSMETMPPFCREMLSFPAMASRCVADGRRRATKLEPDINFKNNVQYCHAGMLNGRCEIDTGGLGTLAILFGSKKGVDRTAVEHRDSVIKTAASIDEDLARQLRDADESDVSAGDFDTSDVALMNAIAGVIKQLISTTVGFRSLTINMAHELSLMMVGMGLLAFEMETAIATLDPVNVDRVRTELQHHRRHIFNECQLGLYVVRNFLSHTSETRYAEVIKPRFAEVDLNRLLEDMVDLHKTYASTKKLTFHMAELALPKIMGSSMEISRLLHNILNNAIKYSYRSTTETQRTIRIWAKVPYDPGFSRLRFAIVIENYGLGVSKEELLHVFKSGFRGEQATAEVPIGAGIGLSEALKIMKLHGGDIKIRSRQVHEGSGGIATYVTSIELIFPYREGTR